jgi:aryl-alcohol dehydrogenase-like predicted oxidoreductase
MRLALGSAQFGMPYGVTNETGQVTPAETKEILQQAVEAGIDLIDTATSYGDSETVLGASGAGNFKIVTKLPDPPQGTVKLAAWVEEQVHASMERLQVASLYGLLLHRPASLWEACASGLAEAMENLKKSKLVRKIGLSVYDPTELDGAARLMHLDLVQVPLNVLDRRLEQSGWLARLHGEGVEIHARSSFLQGLLLLNRKAVPDEFERWAFVWDAWHQYLVTAGIKASVACLNYPLAFPEIDRVVVGVTSLKQLRELLSDLQECGRHPPWPGLGGLENELINPSLWAKP